MTENPTPSRQPSGTRNRAGLVGLRPRRGWELHPGTRSETQLSLGERAAGTARNAVGSWTFMVVVAWLVAGGVIVTARHDHEARLADVLGLLLSGAALIELSLVLMSVRRADRVAAEIALYDLEWASRRAAAVDELRHETDRLRDDVARLVARLDAARSSAPVHEEARG